MKDVDKRINRLIGQLKGVKGMIDEKRECVEILQQITAIKKALDGLAQEVSFSDICRFIPQEDHEKVEKLFKRIVDL